MELNKLEPQENSRTYHCKNGQEVTFENVTHFLKAETTHRLLLEDGRLIIFPIEHIFYISIRAEKFTL